MTTLDPTADDLLRRTESYLSALHGSVARHDNLAAGFGCAGCELRDQIAAALRAAATVPAPAPTDQAACPRCAHDERTRGVLQLSALELYPPDHTPDCPAGLRDRIAALFRQPPGAERLGDATPGEIADAVLAEISGSAVGVGEDAETLRSDLYDDLDQFARQTGNTGLRHAQIRDHLATFLAEGLLRRLADAASGPGGAAGETQQDGRPRCPHCRMPHDLTPEVAAVCASIRASIAANGAQQPECSASRSGDCLREAESETACDIEAGECVHGGKPGGEAQQDEPEALPLLFWDEPAGVVYEDGRITAWLSKAVSLAHSVPAGQLILQPDAGARLRRELTTALGAADDAREAAERAAANCRDAEGCHRVIPCDPGCAARWPATGKEA